MDDSGGGEFGFGGDVFAYYGGMIGTQRFTEEHRVSQREIYLKNWLSKTWKMVATNISIEKLSSGMYFLVVDDKVFKFIKE